MALPQFWRIIVTNKTGADNVFDSGGRMNVKMTGLKVDTTNGDIVYDPLGDDDMAFVSGDTMSDGAEEVTSEIDNTTNEYLGAHIQVEVTHSGGAAGDGTFDVYLDGGDASGELASDASGYVSAEANKLRHVGTLTWEASASDDDVMRSEVIEI